MITVGAAFSDFYKSLSSVDGFVVYENEKRHFPMTDFTAFLSTVPAGLVTTEDAASPFLSTVPELVTLSWGYVSKGEEQNGGELNLHHLVNAALSNELEPTPSLTKLGLTAPRWLDNHPHTGDGVQVVFDAAHLPNWRAARLYLADENGRHHELTIDYEAYVRLSLVTKGFYNWQYLFAKDKTAFRDDKAAFVRDYYRPMRRVLPKLFPKVDYTELFTAMETF